MIHYHGTPIGGTRASAEEFCNGRFLLVPWKRPEDLGRAQTLCRGFMVDNSAFSFWSSGEKPEWMDYIKWCRTFARHPRFHFAIIPDVIDGSEKDNADLIRLWEKNAYVPVRVEGVPVWHLHESLGRLETLVRNWRRVCLGSSGQWATPGTEGWFARMDEAWNVICDEDGYPKTRVHGLRMLRSDIVCRYPFASCDSTNAVQNGKREAEKNGVDNLWGKLTIARRIEQAQSPSRWDRSAKQRDLFELIG